MKTAELAGAALEAFVAKALSDEPGTAYIKAWSDFDALIDREAIHVAPLVGKGFAWCAIVVGRPGGRLPESRGTWKEGPTMRIAVARAIVAARFGEEVDG